MFLLSFAKKLSKNLKVGGKGIVSAHFEEEEEVICLLNCYKISENLFGRVSN